MHLSKKKHFFSALVVCFPREIVSLKFSPPNYVSGGRTPASLPAFCLPLLTSYLPPPASYFLLPLTASHLLLPTPCLLPLTFRFLLLPTFHFLFPTSRFPHPASPFFHPILLPTLSISLVFVVKWNFPPFLNCVLKGWPRHFPSFPLPALRLPRLSPVLLLLGFHTLALPPLMNLVGYLIVGKVISFLRCVLASL